MEWPYCVRWQSSKNISAEDVAEVRENGLEYAERINENFENVFQERLKKGESFKLIDIKAFAPQIIGVEDGLVDIDKKGSWRSLFLWYNIVNTY